jgi:sec-independent protein translocase protein TatC
MADDSETDEGNPSDEFASRSGTPRDSADGAVPPAGDAASDAADDASGDADADAGGDSAEREPWPEADRSTDAESASDGAGGDPETGTDGGEVASADATTVPASSPTDSSASSHADDGLLGDGPESDEEMPLADHIEEMVRRLAVVFAVGGVVTLILYPGADLVNSAFGVALPSASEVINYLWNRHIPGAPEMATRRPRVYGPLELVLTELKVAGLAGLIVGLPVFVYETYLFMRPGLYKRERRYYLAAVPTSLVLALVGVAFAHFVVLPAIFAYFTSYTTGTAVVAFGLKETFNLILLLMGYMAVVFQIPLFVMLAIMMNLVTRDWLIERRLLFWGAFLGLSFLVSPDPTGMAPIIIAATMITLFEGTLFLLRWTRME